MTSLKISEFKPGQPTYGPRLTDEYWEEFKPILVGLDKQGIARKDVVRIATSRYGFRGTYAAMNKRFKIWGLTVSRDAAAVDPSETTPAGRKSLSKDVAERAYPGILVREDDNDINEGALAVKVPTMTPLESSSDRLINALDEVILSTSNLSVDDIRSNNSKKPSQDIPCHDATVASFLDFEPETWLEDITDSSEHPTLNISLHNENDEQMSDIKDTDPSVTKAHAKALSVLPKRSRSQVSSFASCEVQFGRSSQTRSFIHLAKRLREHKPAHTPVSWKSKFSWESSGRSGNFATVTGLEYALDSVSDEIHGEKIGSKQTSLIGLDKTNMSESAVIIWSDNFATFGADSEDELNLRPEETLRDIPDGEIFNRETVPAEIMKREIRKLGTIVEPTGLELKAMSTFTLPIVSEPDVIRLSQKYPLSQAVLCRWSFKGRDLYYLLDRHLFTEPEKTPFLSECWTYLNWPRLRERMTVEESAGILPI